MTTLALIPARGGSKGIPRKNIIDFAGRPLIEWTIDAALRSGAERVLVSTDCPEIAEVSRAAGAIVPFLRPAHLSTDAAGTMPVVLHALDMIPAETLLLLQPTSPLRNSADIRRAMLLHKNTGRPVVSITKAKPWIVSMGDDLAIDSSGLNTARRQDHQTFAPNGAIYIAKAENLLAGETWWTNAVGYEMPQERSIDIDTMTDLRMAEAIAPRATIPFPPSMQMPLPAFAH